MRTASARSLTCFASSAFVGPRLAKVVPSALYCGVVAEGRSWFGEPGPGELVDWEPVLTRAGVDAPPHRVASVYLELAVLVRALEGLSARVRWESPLDRGSLWAGLFDLRENLLGCALDDLRALAG